MKRFLLTVFLGVLVSISALTYGSCSSLKDDSPAGQVPVYVIGSCSACGHPKEVDVTSVWCSGGTVTDQCRNQECLQYFDVEVPAHDHNFVEVDREDSTYCVEGTAYLECCHCSETDEQTLPVRPLPDGTFLESKLETITCPSCAYAAEVDVTEIWCTGGKLTAVCSTHGRFYVDFPAHEHEFVEVSRIEPTYEAAGSVTRECCYCVAVSETETLPKLVDPDADDGTSAETVYMTVTCSRCGHTKDVDVTSIWCSGGVLLEQCRYNGCLNYITVEVPAHGHELVEISRIEPTYQMDGSVTRKCACGLEQETEILPMLIDRGMNEGTFEMGQALVGGTWKLFSVYVPGFDFTFGQMYIGIALCSISVAVIPFIFGFGGHGGGDSPRTSSTDHAKIAEERRNDEF